MNDVQPLIDANIKHPFYVGSVLLDKGEHKISFGSKDVVTPPMFSLKWSDETKGLSNVPLDYIRPDTSFMLIQVDSSE